MSIIEPPKCSGTQSPSEVEVIRQIRSLRFGQVTAMVHDGRIVQIDRVERLRLGQRQHQTRDS